MQRTKLDRAGEIGGTSGVQRSVMDLDVYTFLLDVGFHLLSLVASAIELFNCVIRVRGGSGDMYSSLFYVAMFSLHILQIRLWKRNVVIRRVD